MISKRFISKPFQKSEIRILSMQKYAKSNLIIYAIQLPMIHGRKLVTRAKPAGCPISQPAAAPKDTTPTSSLLPARTTVSGPPESPLQAPRPPVVAVQSVLPMTTAVPKVWAQTAFVMMVFVTLRKCVEVAVEPSAIRPHPETVATSPVKS